METSRGTSKFEASSNHTFREQGTGENRRGAPAATSTTYRRSELRHLLSSLWALHCCRGPLKCMPMRTAREWSSATIDHGETRCRQVRSVSKPFPTPFPLTFRAPRWRYPLRRDMRCGRRLSPVDSSCLHVATLLYFEAIFLGLGTPRDVAPNIPSVLEKACIKTRRSASHDCDAVALRLIRSLLDADARAAMTARGQ